MRKKIMMVALGMILMSTSIVFSGCGNGRSEKETKQTTTTKVKQIKKVEKKQEKIELKTLKDNAQIKKLLSRYPKKLTSEQAVYQGLITIDNKTEMFDKAGKKMWEQFLKDVDQKKDGAVVVCQYTVEGDPILQYVSSVSGKFYYVEDSTRDKYSSEKYIQYTYDYNKIYKQDGHYVAILTNDQNMTFDEAQDVRSLKTAIQLLDVKEK